MSKYINNVLIKLKRKYSKDEIVNYLFNKISSLEIENGKLKSYILELEHNEESKTKLKKEVIRLHKLLNEQVKQA
jgi:hypothetical protein